MKRIRPTDEILAEPYWANLAAGRLTFQRCTECGAWRHPPSPVCWRCHSFAHEWAPVSGKGRLYSYTIARHPVHVSLEAQVPYVIALVELDEGVRLVTSIKGVDASALRIGMRLACTIETLAPGFALPYFVSDPKE